MISTLLLLLHTGSSIASEEQIYIVVNQQNSTESMTRSQVIDLFMGRYNAFPSGEPAITVELKGDNTLKAAFYKQLVGMSLSRINSYWSRLRFSGRKRGSVQFQSKAEMVDYVTQDASAIAYVNASDLRDNMKVVYVVE